MAIIMDGNGRWARQRGRPRREGHNAGASAVRRTVKAAPTLGISTLTLYAFSSDNWRRPLNEVDHLMELLRIHLRSECARCVETGVRISVIGRRDRLPGRLRRQIESTESQTRSRTSLDLRLAIDYSSRDALLRAASLVQGEIEISREAYLEAVARAAYAPPGTRDVDLLIRTGGEMRLSDFLLWECAYAELLFIGCLWPDFAAPELRAAVREFSARDRRFGGLSERSGVSEAPRASIEVMP